MPKGRTKYMEELEAKAAAEGRRVGRDERGVKLANEYKRGGLREVTTDETLVLIDMMRHGLFGEEVDEMAGRPRKIETVEELREKMTDYIKYIERAAAERDVVLIPDIEGFCAYTGISRDTFNQWERTRGAAFSDLIKGFKTATASYKKQLGMRGTIPAVVMAIDFNNNYGYVQQSRVEIETPARLQELPQADAIAARLPDIIEDDDGSAEI